MRGLVRLQVRRPTAAWIEGAHVDGRELRLPRARRHAAELLQPMDVHLIARNFVRRHVNRADDEIGFGDGRLLSVLVVFGGLTLIRCEDNPQARDGFGGLGGFAEDVIRCATESLEGIAFDGEATATIRGGDF